jgi:hypothetical protein
LVSFSNFCGILWLSCTFEILSSIYLYLHTFIHDYSVKWRVIFKFVFSHSFFKFLW